MKQLIKFEKTKWGKRFWMEFKWIITTTTISFIILTYELFIKLDNNNWTIFFTIIISGIVIILIRLYTVRNYIYDIEISESNALIIKYLRYNKEIQLKIDATNMTIKRLYDNRLPSRIVFEQRKPYKDLLTQYEIGAWKHPNSLNTLEKINGVKFINLYKQKM